MNDAFRSSIYKTGADVFFVATDNGVWLSNNQGSFSIKGSSSYALIHLLFSRLDGTQTVDDICAGIGEEKRLIVEQLIKTLVKRNFLRHILLPRENVPLWVQQRYHDQLNFIEQYVDSPFASFMNFRQKHILCIGQGLTLRATLVALSEAGAGYIEIRPLIVSHQEEAELKQMVAASSEYDPEGQYRICLTTSEDWLTSANLPDLEQFDCVLFASDDKRFEEISVLCTKMVQADLIFGAVSLLGNQLISSPLFMTGLNICWECMYRSLVLPSAHSQDAASSLAPVSSALACYQLVHTLFCYYTGIPLREEACCTIVDCDTLVTKTHRILPHPACYSLCANPAVIKRLLPMAFEDEQSRPDLPRPEDPEPLVLMQDTLVARTSYLTDSKTGPLLSVEEGAISQVPFAASKCVVRSVRHVPGTHRSHTLVCQGLSARETRNQVVLQALEWLSREILQYSRLELTQQGTLLTHIDAGLAFGSILKSAEEADLHKHIGKDLSQVSVGVGWSRGESIYRALSNSSILWKQKVGDAPLYQSIAIAQLRKLRIGDYLCEILATLICADLQVTIDIAPTGFFVAVAHAFRTTTGYGAGVTEIQASMNALMDLASRLIAQGDGENEEISPIHFLLDIRSWKEALAKAEAIRQERGTSVTWWDMSEILPFTASQCFIAGTNLERGVELV